MKGIATKVAPYIHREAAHSVCSTLVGLPVRPMGRDDVAIADGRAA
jgi:hypothetical protein